MLASRDYRGLRSSFAPEASSEFDFYFDTSFCLVALWEYQGLEGTGRDCRDILILKTTQRIMWTSDGREIITFTPLLTSQLSCEHHSNVQTAQTSYLTPVLSRSAHIQFPASSNQSESPPDDILMMRRPGPSRGAAWWCYKHCRLEKTHQTRPKHHQSIHTIHSIQT